MVRATVAPGIRLSLRRDGVTTAKAFALDCSTMLQVSGSGGGTTLTGTVFERGEEPPSFKGAPDEEAPYVWVCDAFYEVESGGTPLEIDGEEIRVAFESPMPRGFDTKDQAVKAAEEHIRTQFARIGVEDVEVEVEKEEPA
jgi:hypothetical protein